jgi:hypothetical protein
MPFDLAGARREGYADKDILSYLAGRDGIVPEFIPGSDEEKIQELLRRRQAKMLPYEYASGAPDSGSPGTPVTPRAQYAVPPAAASAGPVRRDMSAGYPNQGTTGPGQRYAQMSPAEINTLWSEQGIQPTLAPVSLLDMAMEPVGQFLDEADAAKYLPALTLLGMVKGPKNTSLKLYRGVSSISPAAGNYYSPSREFAREFTHSGLDKEIAETVMPRGDIYKPKRLPFAGDEASMSKAIEEAAGKGFNALFVSEGTKQPHSVFVIDPSKISKPSR